MASVFDEMFAETVAMTIAQFGEDVEYRPLGNAGNAKTIKAVVQGEARNEEFTGQGFNDYNGTVIEISARNNTEGHVSPTEQNRSGTPDVVIIDSRRYTVQRKLFEQPVGGMWRLQLFDGGA